MSIVARKTWGMPGPLGPAMKLPAQILYLHHSVTAAANGYAAVRTVAQIGVQRFGRASYSYACTPDGTLYELQGTHIGAHTAGQNSSSLAVVLVGNYETTQITDAQVDAVAWLHRHLTSTGKLRAGAPLRGHRDAPGASTACPGRIAYTALPTIRSRITAPPSEEDDMFEQEDRDLLREVVIALRTEPKAKSGHYGGRVLREVRADAAEVLRQVTDDSDDSRTVADRAKRALVEARQANERLERLEADIAEIKAAVLSDASQ